MIDVLYLACCYLAYHRLKAGLLVAAIALVLYLPIGLNILVQRASRQLTARAASTDLIVGTSIEYFSFRRLRPQTGRLPAQLGDCVLGARAAARTNVAVGGQVMSSPESVFDITGVYPLKMNVVGILEPTGTPDDDAVFVDVKTAWVIAGLGHGHKEPAADAGKSVQASPALKNFTQITDENRGTFHFHGDQESFPISSVIAVPRDDRSAALLEGRFLDPADPLQIVRPDEVLADLLATVLTIRRYVMIGVGLLAIATLSLMVLVFLLSMQIRRQEIDTLVNIGGTPSTTNQSNDAAFDTTSPEARPILIVVNYPLEYFARRIGGDLIEVRFPVPEDHDPAYWEPSGDQIAEIQSADLVILNGADYAKWTLRATLPWSRTVVTCEDMEEDLIEIPDAVVHSHVPEGEHSHAGLISESWLDPDLAIRQAREVYDAISGRLPDHKSALEARFLDLERELKTFAEELDHTLGQTSVRWLSAKPRFHYMLARYDTMPEVLHWEAKESISSSQWESLVSRLGGESAVLLWSEPPLNATRDRLLKAGVQSIVLDIAATRLREGDFLSVMRGNLNAIQSKLADRP
jgi:ABC-type Zn uptake system ZnuABC Zn-binding protein ZnuA